MGWFDRWFGRRQAPAGPPWSFPCRLVLSDALAMTVFAHDVQTLGPTLACWTFVSDGLIGYGQKELLLTVVREADEHPEPLAREVAKFFLTVRGQAAEGRRVDVGDISVFGGPGPAGAQGFAYAEPLLLDGVDLPSSALAAIPLIGAEAEVAAVLSVNRVIGRLALHYRYYPYPIWWDRSRSAIAAYPDDRTSMLARFARRHVPGVSGRMEREGFRLRVHPSARDTLARLLDEASPDTVLALVMRPDVAADGRFVWRPGVHGMEAATPPGSRAERLTVTFVAFALGVTDTGGRVLEDGVAVMFRQADWDAFRSALRLGQPLTVTPTADYAPFVLEWIPESYVSPIDGRVFEADGGWTRFYPIGPPTPQKPGPLLWVVLLADIDRRVSPAALVSYMNAIGREFWSSYGDRGELTEVLVRVVLEPGEPARVVERSETDGVRIAEMVASVPVPPVTGGTVAFEFCLTNRPDAANAP